MIEVYWRVSRGATGGGNGRPGIGALIFVAVTVAACWCLVHGFFWLLENMSNV